MQKPRDPGEVMDPNTVAIIKTIGEVLLAIGGLSGLITVLVNRQKTKAEAKKIGAESDSLVAKTKQELPATTADSLVGTSGDVIEQYKQLLKDYQIETNNKIDNLQRMLGTYARRITYLMGGIQTLVKQMVDLGHDPCWSPDDWQPWVESRTNEENPPKKV